jgi:hypothetical protein
MANPKIGKYTKKTHPYSSKASLNEPKTLANSIDKSMNHTHNNSFWVDKSFKNLNPKPHNPM